MTPHHFGVARVGAGVTDLEPGRRLYGALGFDCTAPFDLGTAIADQSETPGSPLVIWIVRRDGFDLELVQHGGARPPARPPARRPMNQLGLTHLALSVDDTDRVGRIIVDHGGEVLDLTRTGSLGCDAVFCTDPFGVRLLLLGPGPTAFPRPEPGSDGIAVAHVGLCAADLAATASFYAAIGFEVGEAVELGTAFGTLAEIDDVPLTVRPMREGGFPFLLMQWGPPRDPGYPVRLPLNRNGDLVHLGTHCDAFEPMLELAVGAGATAVERTRAQFPAPALGMPWEGDPHGWIFVLDPNGVQIEIVGPHVD